MPVPVCPRKHIFKFTEGSENSSVCWFQINSYKRGQKTSLSAGFILISSELNGQIWPVFSPSDVQVDRGTQVHWGISGEYPSAHCWHLCWLGRLEKGGAAPLMLAANQAMYVCQPYTEQKGNIDHLCARHNVHLQPYMVRMHTPFADQLTIIYNKSD